MYNPYVSSYGPDDGFGFEDSPWLRQQQDAVGMPSQPYMGGFGYTPPKPPTPPQQPSINPSPAVNPISQLSSSRSFFQPDTPPSPVGDTMSGAPSSDNLNPPDSPIVSAYKKLLGQPEGAAHSAYSDFLKRGYPQESQYEPSKWRSLLGMATSGLLAYNRDPNAIAKGEAITDEPYRRAIAQYGMEGTKLYQAANEEDRQYQNQLRNAAGLVTEERNSKTAAHQQRQDEINQQKADNIERHRKVMEELDRIEKNRPNVHYFEEKGGYVWAVDAKDLTHPVNTGIKNTDLTDADKIAKQIAGSLEEIKARIAGDIKVKQTQGAEKPAAPHPVLIQPRDKDGNPIGSPVKLDLNDLPEGPVDVGGVIGTPPRQPAEAKGSTSVVSEEPPPPNIIQRLFPFVPQPEAPPKKTTTRTPTPTPAKPAVPEQPKKDIIIPSKKAQAKEGSTKTTVPASATDKPGTSKQPDTTQKHQVRMKDPNGHEFMVDESEVEDAVKHKWSKADKQ